MEITDFRVRVFRFPPANVSSIPQTNGTLRSLPGADRTTRITEVVTEEGLSGICYCARVPNGLIVESYPESKWRVIPPIDPIEPEKSLVSEPNPIKNVRIQMTMKPGIGYVMNDQVSKDYEVNPRSPNSKLVKARPEKQYGDLLINQASLADSWC